MSTLRNSGWAHAKARRRARSLAALAPLLEIFFLPTARIAAGVGQRLSAPNIARRRCWTPGQVRGDGNKKGAAFRRPLSFGPLRKPVELFEPLFPRQGWGPVVGVGLDPAFARDQINPRASGTPARTRARGRRPHAACRMSAPASSSRRCRLCPENSRPFGHANEPASINARAK